MTQTADPKTSSILDLVNKTVDLPTIPTVLVKLNEVVSNPSSTAADVASVIACDPAVSTNILRIVNSAYYGLQVRISSVSLAVSMMGFNMTKKVALKAAIFSVFARQNQQFPHFSPEKFWSHSIYTGCAARTLAAESPVYAGLHPEDIYVCGLLHDIGKILLVENKPKVYAEVLKSAAARGAHSLKPELEALGFTHADVGSVLAIKWFLPEDLTIAIRYHHQPERDPFHRSLSSLIHIADSLAWKANHASSQESTGPEVHAEALGQVGLTTKQVEGLSDKIAEDYATTANW
jgi:putative nucleotidyltransferase with HDIG domain